MLELVCFLMILVFVVPIILAGSDLGNRQHIELLVGEEIAAMAPTAIGAITRWRTVKQQGTALGRGAGGVLIALNIRPPRRVHKDLRALVGRESRRNVLIADQHFGVRLPVEGLPEFGQPIRLRKFPGAGAESSQPLVQVGSHIAIWLVRLEMNAAHLLA